MKFHYEDENKNEYVIEAETEELAIAKYNEIKFREANPLPPTYTELRQKEYLEKGITPDKMIIAL
ncbi:MAG: hypothetical protein FJ214_11665 [Ignavibacteria bacterium]|nr:hypothetical protein [Ignavibacteria bacterium]